MPIYEFECRTCGLRFEEILPASSEAVPQCPQCQTNDSVQKCLSACAKAPQTGPSSQGCAPRGGFS